MRGKVRDGHGGRSGRKVAGACSKRFTRLHLTAEGARGRAESGGAIDNPQHYIPLVSAPPFFINIQIN